MNQKISKILPLLTCLAIMASLATRVEAQNPKNPAKAPAMQSAVYCNQVAELYGKELQEKANRECRTVYPCIPCTQQETGAKTCMQLTIQPSQESKCRATVKLADPKTGQSAPASESTAFTVSILQEPCFYDGVTLRAFVYTSNTTMPFNPKDYTYTWEVDGKPMGNSFQLYCVSGGVASVKVTQVATKQVGSASVNISFGDQTTQMTENGTGVKPIAGYQKLSFFGECPTYSVAIYQDGTIDWNGLYFTNPLGKRSGKVTPETIKKLQDKARDMGFLKMQNAYPMDPIADANGTIVFMILDGQPKQVTDNFGAPKELKELQKMFDDIIKKQGWAKPAPMKKTVDNKPAKTVPGVGTGN
ncbi:MAG: hypothetical protein IT261_03665 [Saprospiraceae bacterium]|nr:hypothetical protein [Saprospiraceae bacterium]